MNLRSPGPRCALDDRSRRRLAELLPEFACLDRAGAFARVRGLEADILAHDTIGAQPAQAMEIRSQPRDRFPIDGLGLKGRALECV
jgi:hypothetical protein